MNKTRINIKNILTIFLGTLTFSVGIEWFSKPNKIITGGATGASIILNNIIKTLTELDLPISLIVLLINIPIFIFSYIMNGSKFVKQSIFATVMNSGCLALMSKIPVFFKIENDMFLATILTGVVCGVGSGLILKAGAASGGTDMLANALNKILPQFQLSKIIFALDASIVLFGFLIFGSTKTAYSIISIFIISKIINYLLAGLRFARAVFIVSDKVDEISEEIFKVLKRGNTNIPCKGMYTKKNKNLLMVVLLPKEIIKLKRIIEAIDKQAFVIITPAQEVVGNGF